MSFGRMGAMGRGFGHLGGPLGRATAIALPNLLPNSKMQQAQATNGTQLNSNWDFSGGLTGYTVTQSGSSTFVVNGTKSATITYDGTNAVRADYSFATVIGNTYTVRNAINTITTMGIACDVGTTQGGFNYVNGSTIGLGAAYFTFVATGTTAWVRIRAKGSAGSANIYSLWAKQGGIPPNWKTGGAGTNNDLEIYMEVVAMGTATDLPGLAGVSVPYMDVHHYGTVGAGGNVTMSFHMNQQNDIATTNGANLTGVIFDKLIAGALTGYGSILLSIFPSNGSNNLIPSIVPQKQLTMGASWTKETTSGAINNAATTNCFESIEFTALASQSVDSTIRIALPAVTSGINSGTTAQTP